MLANVNVTVNKGTYVGTGNISKISIQSDGIATAGIFNAAQETPAFTTTTGAGDEIEQTISTTLGNAIDIMVVPTGAAKPITFMVRVDDVDYTVTSSDVTLESGNSYNYTLSLNSTFLNVDKVSVAEWNHLTKENLTLVKTFNLNTAPNGIYAVNGKGKGLSISDADATCVAVALIHDNHKFMIAKADAERNNEYELDWGHNSNDLSLNNYSNVDGTNNYAFLPKPDGSFDSTPYLSDDYTTWIAGGLSDFNGKSNTAVIKADSQSGYNMCTALKTFNAATDGSNAGRDDWYVPALGQLALIYLNIAEINEALVKVGGTAILAQYESHMYWSSTEYDGEYAFCITFGRGHVHKHYKGYDGPKVRFIRDIE